MNRKYQNDRERDRDSPNTRTDEIGRGEDVRNRSDQSDLGRAQSEGNLGNERTRDRSRGRSPRDRDDLRHDDSL